MVKKRIEAPEPPLALTQTRAEVERRLKERIRAQGSLIFVDAEHSPAYRKKVENRLTPTAAIKGLNNLLILRGRMFQNGNREIH